MPIFFTGENQLRHKTLDKSPGGRKRGEGKGVKRFSPNDDLHFVWSWVGLRETKEEIVYVFS